LNAPQLFPSATIGPFGRRQKRERGARIPVTILTGFLGAGKTTLLKYFLATPQGAGTAVVVNEFGEAGIDDVLLRPSSEETVLLGNGCLCCVARSDLQITLRRLVADRARGACPDFRRIVIETSGLAEPGPILQTFSTDRALGGQFHVDVVAAAVDAAAGAATLEWSAEAREQVILADTLIVTKSDLAGGAATDSLLSLLRRLNPRATMVSAENGVHDPDWLIASHDTTASVFVAEQPHSDGIASFTLRDQAPMPWQAFARAMEVLTSLRGPDLLRVKGFLNVEGCQGPVLVQFVQHLAHPPVELEQWPDPTRETRVVFITRNIPEAQVRDLLTAVRAIA
jgi:G3E family GTPase